MLRGRGVATVCPIHGSACTSDPPWDGITCGAGPESPGPEIEAIEGRANGVLTLLAEVLGCAQRGLREQLPWVDVSKQEGFPAYELRTGVFTLCVLAEVAGAWGLSVKTPQWGRVSLPCELPRGVSAEEAQREAVERVSVRLCEWLRLLGFSS